MFENNFLLVQIRKYKFKFEAFLIFFHELLMVGYRWSRREISLFINNFYFLQNVFFAGLFCADFDYSSYDLSSHRVQVAFLIKETLYRLP